jgi:hypothetical protein
VIRTILGGNAFIVPEERIGCRRLGKHRRRSVAVERALEPHGRHAGKRPHHHRGAPAGGAVDDAAHEAAAPTRAMAAIAREPSA